MKNKASLALIALMWLTGHATAQSYGGRLTLVPGQPYLSQDVTSQQIAYSPAGFGNTVIVSGVPVPFTSGPADQAGPVINLAGSATWTPNSIYDVFAVVRNGAVVIGTGPAWTNQQQQNGGAYNKIAATMVITTGTGGGQWFNPGAAFNGATSQPFASSAYNGASLAANIGMANYLGQDYGSSPQQLSQFVLSAPSDDYIEAPNGSTPIALDYSDDLVTWTNAYSATLNTTGGAGQSYTVNTAIVATAAHRAWRVGIAGNGTNRVKVGQVAFYSSSPQPTPVGAREPLTMSSGVNVNGASMPLQLDAATSIACAAGQCTLLGSIQIDAIAGQVTCNFSYGLNRKCGLSNVANETQICLKAGETTPGPPFSYTPGINGTAYTFTPSHGNAGNGLTILQTLARRSFEVKYQQAFFLNSASGPAAYWAGIGINGGLTPCDTWIVANYDNTGTSAGQSQTARCVAQPFAGTAIFGAIEGGRGNVSAFWGDSSEGNMMLEACFPY